MAASAKNDEDEDEDEKLDIFVSYFNIWMPAISAAVPIVNADTAPRKYQCAVGPIWKLVTIIYKTTASKKVEKTKLLIVPPRFLKTNLQTTYMKKILW